MVLRKGCRFFGSTIEALRRIAALKALQTSALSQTTRFRQRKRFMGGRSTIKIIPPHGGGVK